MWRPGTLVVLRRYSINEEVAEINVEIEGESIAMKDNIIYINGEFLNAENATISVYDHGLLHGDGIFEGIRAYDGVVFQLNEHINRLYQSARSLYLNIPVNKKDMINLVLEVLRRNNLNNAYVRLVVTRGVGVLGIDPRTCRRPSIIIIAESSPAVYEKGIADRGLRAKIVSVRRDAVDATSHEIKSLNYVNSVMARIEATLSGADEAVLLDPQGFVCESPICNLFTVNGNRLTTPSVASGILHGITRAKIMGIGDDMGLIVEERNITPYELINSDEVFLTGTHAEIAPIVMINDITIGNGTIGPKTCLLLQQFQQITRNPMYGVRIQEEEVSS